MSGVAVLDSAGVGALVQLVCPIAGIRGSEICARGAQPTGMAVMQVSGLLKPDAGVRLCCRSGSRELSLGFSQDSNEFRGSMGQARATARHQIDVARHVQLPHFHFFHPTVSISHCTHMRGTMATPMPICTKRLMLSMVGISMGMFRAVRLRAKSSMTRRR